VPTNLNLDSIIYMVNEKRTLSMRFTIALIAGVIAPVLLTLTACIVEPEDEDEVNISEIRDGVWLHSTIKRKAGDFLFSSNGLIIRQQGHLVLIDTARSEAATRTLMAIIESEIGLPVERAIITHAHLDRLSGSDYLQSQDIAVFGTGLTRQLSRVDQYPVPWSGLEIFYPGYAHSADNIVIWLPEHNILFGGCAVRALSATMLGSWEVDAESWAQAMQRVEKRYTTVETVIPGHGDPGNDNLIDHTLALLAAVQ
jgi:glyoxylase-like metal-dependent hydrolase (beta-lactamase superfamily II)